MVIPPGVTDLNSVGVSKHSTDPIFLGYPYGFIDVDRHARVTNKEVDYYRTILLAKSGDFESMIHSSLKPIDAHSILDNIY